MRTNPMLSRWSLVVLATVMLLGLARHTAVASAGDIGCGAVLGGGAAYFLDRDLTCFGPGPALTVRGGATLYLRRHTLTCGGGSDVSVGIKVLRATLGSAGDSGSVRGCHVGVGASQAVVTNITLRENYYGLLAEESTIYRNTAVRNTIGFSGYLDTGFSTFQENVARHNVYGFWFDEFPGTTLIANVANRNGTGFSLGHHIQAEVYGNVAKRNTDVGFAFYASGATAISNVAKENGTHGFFVDDSNVRLSDNVASDNGRDGFSITGDTTALVLTSNDAIRNGRDGIRLSANTQNGMTVGTNYVLLNRKSGIHVVRSRTSSGPVTISGNTAVGNGLWDGRDDNPGCDGTTWEENEFGTTSQGCLR